MVRKGCMSQKYFKRKRKNMTNKLLSNVSCGSSQRARFDKSKRKALKAVSQPSLEVSNRVLRFGSFNVNGMDLEASFVIERLIIDKNFDVRLLYYII